MLDILLRVTISGGLAVLVLWMLCRALPRLSPATRAVIWWCAAAKFLLSLFLVVPVEIPAEPRLLHSFALIVEGPGPQISADLPSGTAAHDLAASETEPQPHNGRQPTHVGGSAPSDRSSGRAVSIPVLVLAAWLCGVVTVFAVALRRWWRLRRVLAEADDAPIAVRNMANELAYRVGLSQAPEIRMSDGVETPFVTGFSRPIIVLPGTRFCELPRESQRMALCHELAHIRRRDLVLGVVPAVAERIFFFHPLALYAAREYAVSREAACDQLVIESLDASPHDYGRLLLDLGVSPGRSGLAAAGAPYSFSNLKRRLVMLRIPVVPSTFSRLTAAVAVCAAVALLTPLHLVARDQNEPARPAVRGDQYLEPERDADAERARPSTRSKTERKPAAPHRARWGDDHDRFIVLRSDSDDAIWHGSSRDHARAKRHQKAGEPLLWFMRGGEEFVVRDRGIVDEAEAIWEPVGRLGGEMGELGGKLGALGGRQGDFGAKQGALGGEVGRLGARQAALGLQQAALALKQMRQIEDEERTEIEREQRELEKEMRQLSDEMQKLSEQMREFDAPMQDLERDMRPLSKELERLGKEMEGLSHEAEAQMKALIERTLKEGLAERVR
jgi:bla regulator protein BlaR1